jgi:hypothetical protein
MIDADGILPALLQVVKGDIPPADHKLQTGILSRYVPRHICHSLSLVLLSLQRLKANFGESGSILLLELQAMLIFSNNYVRGRGPNNMLRTCLHAGRMSPA